MFFQFDALTADAIIGIGLMFGLALVFTMITYKTMISFLVWLLIFNAFVVWGGLLPLWTLILEIVVLVTAVYIQSSSRMGSVVP